MNQEVDDYLKPLGESRRTALSTLRQAILTAAPDADEMVQYGMPTYYQSGMICAFADRGTDMTFYVANARVLDRYESQLSRTTVETGCIRFRKLEDLPLAVIGKIVEDSIRFHQHPRT